MTPADVLDAAADSLERDGWCQGVGRMPDGRRCAANAISRVAPTKADLRVAKRIVERRTGFLPEWNDTPDQTAANVISTFRAVAAHLREGERGPREVSP